MIRDHEGPCRAGGPALALALALLPVPASGQAFSPPVNISQSGNGSYLPSLVRDRGGPEAGTLRVFWHDFTIAPNGIWCADDSSGSFGAGAPCPPAGGQSWSPRAASDPMGVTHLVWRERIAGQDEILHASHDGVGWSAATNLSNSAGASRNPVIALDPWDRPHVAWEEDAGGAVRFFEAHFDGSAWSAPADTGLPFVAGAFVDTLRLACDGAGTLHAAWHDGATSLTEVFHASRPDGGTWSAPVNLSNTPGSYSVEPAIAVASSDEVHVAWVEQDGTSGTFAEICLSSLPSGGAWSPRQDVTQLRRDAFHPAMAVGSDDVPRIAFGSGPLGAREVLFMSSPSSTPTDVSLSAAEDSDRASLVLDDLDQPWIAWQEGSPPTPEIFLAGPDAVPAPPILLRARKSGPDVVLSWTGGLAPFHALRADAPDTPAPWGELTPPGGIVPAAWTDAGVVGDGRALFYMVE